VAGLLVAVPAAPDVVRRMVRIGPGIEDLWCPISITQDAEPNCASWNSSAATPNLGPYEVTFVAPASGHVDLLFRVFGANRLDNVFVVETARIFGSEGVSDDFTCYKGSIEANPSARVPAFDSAVPALAPAALFSFAETFADDQSALEARGWSFVNALVQQDDSATDRVSASDLGSISAHGTSGSLALNGSASQPAEARTPVAGLQPGTRYTVVAWWRNDQGSTQCTDQTQISPHFEIVVVTDTCVRDASTACLLGGKFKVQLEMRDFASPPVRFTGRVMSFPGGRAESDQAVFFDSFNAGNFELGVKMVDGCSLNGRYWLFTGGLTNARYEIEVTDSVSGASKLIANPAGTLPLSTADTSAFSCTPNGAPTCVRNGNRACLLGGRFRVVARMWDFSNPPKMFAGHVMLFPTDRAESDQAAFFDSFAAGNFEWGVKMVDACTFNARHWAFVGGLSTAFTHITIENAATGQTVRYTNLAGTVPRSVGDTSTLTCP